MRKFINVLAFILIVAGALNWGLWGFFQFDFIAWLCGGNTSWLSRLIYSFVGLSGLWILSCFGKCCKALCCKPGECPVCGGSSKKEGQ